MGGEDLPVPWKSTSVLEERVRFVIALDRGEGSMSALCAAYGISRETGYKWRDRYALGGLDALRDASRARRTPAERLASAMSDRLVALREMHPSWGPKKLRVLLRREQPEGSVPAASTIGEVLRRAGLTASPARRRRAVGTASVDVAASAANDMWGIDFKGWFRTGDGQRCDPLTVSDVHSRYLLMCEIVDASTEGVWRAVERLFHERGLPGYFRMDNGSPFGGQGAGGLTKLSVRWVKLGIGLSPITPGCPQQNGRHERMHRTLKAETSRPPAASARAQQARFDTFRRAFNEERPHEALDQTVPAAHYRPSQRLYGGKLEEPWYDAEHRVERVRSHGEIRLDGALIYISDALPGELVGIAELANGSRLVRFAHIDLGVIPHGRAEFFRFGPPRTGRTETEQTRNTVNHVPGPKCQL